MSKIISLRRRIREDGELLPQRLEAVVACETEALAASDCSCYLLHDVDEEGNDALGGGWMKSEVAGEGILHALDTRITISKNNLNSCKLQLTMIWLLLTVGALPRRIHKHNWL